MRTCISSHGGLSCGFAHYHVVLFDALPVRYDFYVAECTAETLVKLDGKNIIYFIALVT